MPGLLSEGCGLIAADPRLELEMIGDRAQDRIRHQARTGVVEVGDVLAAWGLVPGPFEVALRVDGVTPPTGRARAGRAAPRDGAGRRATAVVFGPRSF